METIKNLKTRRSIRRFTDTPVPEVVFRRIVETAAYAPSWKNSQTAGYVIVRSADLKTEIAENGVLGFAHNTGIINRAAALVVVTTQDGVSGYEKDGSFSTVKGSHWQSFDAGIAAQTFCLAAHEEGLGTVILGMYDEAKVKAVLDIPEELSVSALIAIGYPDEEPKAPRRKDLDQLLSFR